MTPKRRSILFVSAAALLLAVAFAGAQPQVATPAAQDPKAVAAPADKPDPTLTLEIGDPKLKGKTMEVGVGAILAGASGAKVDFERLVRDLMAARIVHVGETGRPHRPRRRDPRRDGHARDRVPGHPGPLRPRQAPGHRAGDGSRDPPGDAQQVDRRAPRERGFPARDPLVRHLELQLRILREDLRLRPGASAARLRPERAARGHLQDPDARVGRAERRREGLLPRGRPTSRTRTIGRSSGRSSSPPISPPP